MKTHFLFVAMMTLFIISCGDNSSGDKKKSNPQGTLIVSNGNYSQQCQGLNGALLMYDNQYYQIDMSNQELVNTINMLIQQASYNNGGYNNGGYYNQYNYTIVNQDECSNHYTIEFSGRANNQTGNYGGYNQSTTMTIDSFTIR